MNDEENKSEQQTQVSLGETLKNARVAAGVSIEQLAETMKLPPSKLHLLENDEYAQLGPTTFVKGYVKSYCREFKLNTDAVLGMFPEQIEPTKRSNMQSFSKRTEKEAHDSRLMLVSYVILAIALGSSALWWWQNSTPVTTTVEQSESNSVAIENPLEDEAPIEQYKAEPAQANEQVNTPADTQITELTQTNDNLVIGQEPAREIKTENTTVAQTVAEDTVAEDDDQSTLVMTFNDESWVEIHDAEGERIAFGVKKAGYVMTVSGVEPFSIVLGKHQVVDITLNGEVVDTSGFAKNRLAKFKLPLVE